jgi:hypothetical protein
MREFDRLGLTVDAPEVLEKRTPLSKTFDLGNGKFRLRTANSLLHYVKDGALEDIDLEPVDMGDYLLVDKAPYILTIAKDRPFITYKGKASGLEIEMELTHVDGAVPVLTLEGTVYKGIPDNDLHIKIKPSGVSTEQHIKTSAGAKTLGWRIRQNHSQPVVLETLRTATDAVGNRAEIQITRSRLEQKEGKWEHVFEERLTGMKLEKDKVTRKLTAVPSVTYPGRVS